MVAAIAPRAFLVIAPLRDGNFEVSGVRQVMDTATPVYRLLGKPEALAARYPDSRPRLAAGGAGGGLCMAGPLA